LRAVEFSEVAKSQRRQPSWLVGRTHKAEQSVRQAIPPKLPSEFVSAMRQELDSLRPEGNAATPAAADGVRRSLRASPPSAQPEVVIDPAASEAFFRAVEILAKVRDEVLAQTAGQLAELAAAIARRVISHELSVDRGVIHRLVSEGLAALGQRDRVVVRLGQGFAAECDAIEQRFRAGGERFEVIVDPRLDAYGCVVETELGQVDESLDTRLATLLQALKPESESP